MTEVEMQLVQAALVEVGKLEPEIAQALSRLFTSLRTEQPLSPAIKHLQAVVALRALGLSD